MALQSNSDNWFRQDDFSAKVSRDDDGTSIVTLAGEFDLSTAAELRECLAAPEVLDAEA